MSIEFGERTVISMPTFDIFKKKMTTDAPVVSLINVYERFKTDEVQERIKHIENNREILAKKARERRLGKKRLRSIKDKI